MKTELLQNVKAQPYTSGSTIDRRGFASAVLACAIAAEGTLSVTVTHSDDDTTYSAITDELAFIDKPTKNGVYTAAVSADEIVNIDIDLSGLKRYVKFTLTGADTAAIVLGDSSEQSV